MCFKLDFEKIFQIFGVGKTFSVVDCPETGVHNHKDNNEASVAQQWWVYSHIQHMSEGLWDIRTQWHSVTFNLGGCQNALTLFTGRRFRHGHGCSDWLERLRYRLEPLQLSNMVNRSGPWDSIQYCSLNVLHALSDTSSHVFLLFHQKHLTELTDRSLSTNLALPNSGGGSLELWHGLRGCVQIMRDHRSGLQTDLVCLVFHADAVHSFISLCLFW